MNKKLRFALTLLAVMLCMAAFASPTYADAGPDVSPATIAAIAPTPTPTASPSPFTPDGTGTVLDAATDGDGKEFYTILAPDEHVFYLVIDRQRNSENVYFLDAVTEKDLLSLAQVTEEDEEPVISTPRAQPTPQPTTQPEQEPQTQPQSSMGGIVALLLTVAVIAVGVFCFFKFRKPKKSVKGKSDLDEYDFGEDDDETYEVGDAAPDTMPKTEDDEQ